MTKIQKFTYHLTTDVIKCMIISLKSVVRRTKSLSYYILTTKLLQKQVTTLFCSLTSSLNEYYKGVVCSK